MPPNQSLAICTFFVFGVPPSGAFAKLTLNSGSLLLMAVGFGRISVRPERDSSQ